MEQAATTGYFAAKRNNRAAAIASSLDPEQPKPACNERVIDFVPALPAYPRRVFIPFELVGVEAVPSAPPEVSPGRRD
jgi:hypothetical protein